MSWIVILGSRNDQKAGVLRMFNTSDAPSADTMQMYNLSEYNIIQKSPRRLQMTLNVRKKEQLNEYCGEYA